MNIPERYMEALQESSIYHGVLHKKSVDPVVIAYHGILQRRLLLLHEILKHHQETSTRLPATPSLN